MKSHTMASARKKVELTQREMAKGLDVSEMTYIAWENGKRDIPTRKFEKFCEITGVQANDIFLPEIAN